MDKFSLTWRTDLPVLLQRNEGFWTREDGRQWVDAVKGRYRQQTRRCLVQDQRRPRLPAAEGRTSEFRDEAASFEFAHGLARMIGIHSGGVAQMQRRRVHDALPYGDKFDYVVTVEEAEARLAELIDGQSV